MGESSPDFDVKEEITGMFKKAFGRKTSTRGDSPTATGDQEKEPLKPETTEDVKEEPIVDISAEEVIVITSRENVEIPVQVKLEDQKMTKATVDKEAEDQATVEANSRESSPEFNIKEEITGMLKKTFNRKSSGKSDSSTTSADQQNEPSEPKKTKPKKEETVTTDISDQDAIVIASRESSVTTDQVKVEAKVEDQ